jgi:hypothetical protein
VAEEAEKEIWSADIGRKPIICKEAMTRWAYGKKDTEGGKVDKGQSAPQDHIE